MTAGVELDCWRRIGVWGDGSCPELVAAVHCRNCPVFAAAGRSLLDRERPPGYLEEWTEALARETEGLKPGEVSLLVFRLGTEHLAVPTRLLVEVAEPGRMQRLPHRSNKVLAGLVNVRGDICLCASLEGLLSLEPAQAVADRGSIFRRLLVAERQGERWAFLVDEVLGFHHVDPSALQSLPATVAKSAAAYSKGLYRHGEQHVAWLDEDLLFSALRRCVK